MLIQNVFYHYISPIFHFDFAPPFPWLPFIIFIIILPFLIRCYIFEELQNMRICNLHLLLVTDNFPFLWNALTQQLEVNEEILRETSVDQE